MPAASSSSSVSSFETDRPLGYVRGAEARTVIARPLRRSAMAVTHVRIPNRGFGYADPNQEEDAFLVAIQLRDTSVRLWRNGSPVETSYRAGTSTVYSARDSWLACIEEPTDAIHFAMPKTMLDELADFNGARRINELRQNPGIGTSDTTLYALGTSLLEATARPHEVNRLFIDHVTLAMQIHIADAYGGMRFSQGPARGGLTPGQLERVLDLIRHDPGNELRLAELAGACNLSVSYFSRAFKQSTGTTPHRWLMAYRIELARELLNDGELAIAQIAERCGFADQAHLTRVFTAAIGTTPGLWRRGRG